MPPMSQAVPTNGMGYMGYQPYNMQNMISALPGQDPNMPPQQPYMPAQQPIYQQVSLPFCYCIAWAALNKLNLGSIALVTRWLPLVAHSSSSWRRSNSSSSRLPRRCSAAQRLSSSPLTESSHPGWSDTRHFFPSLHPWTLMTPSGKASHTSSLPCCDVVAT